uniref:Translation initiation factor IF-2, chloroplastic n=1 Tax=Taenioma perpusillum TaxID=210852 RepID=A0A1Z1MRC1_9FLOR|nr:translation initiation factor 2 [Taenioma perpusillum]ARW68506.1 translation initiation factor 2 [Taenioma perpusillum]
MNMVNTNSFEKILQLKLPKLLHSIIKKNNRSDNLIDDSKSFINSVKMSALKTSLPNTLSRFEKKYKTNSVSHDNSDLKKNKNRLNKKNKRSIIDSSDFLIEDGSSMYKQQFKSIKGSKNKKKEKKKLSYLNSNINNSNIKDDNTIIIKESLTVKNLSNNLDIPEAEIIKYLFLKGISVTINDTLDISIIKEIAQMYNVNIAEDVKEVTKPKKYQLNHVPNQNSSIKRSPIVTIFGHVDHGKTTLLDSILKTNIVDKEYGGITQSINSYEIEHSYNSKSYKFIIIDTPGHEAFTSIRLRGAKITDIALLVVAADDGLKPQTVEAIKYILEMQLLYIVVINKIDKKDTNSSKVIEELAQYNIISDQWGGDVPIVEVSALKRYNIDILLSKLCLLSDSYNWTASKNISATGTILESYISKTKGVVANLIVQNGTLKIGDIIVAGSVYGKVKSLIKNNNNLKFVDPSSSVSVLAFSNMPESGCNFCVVYHEKEAKDLINRVGNLKNSIFQQITQFSNKRILSRQFSNLKQLNIIINTDTQSSLEALISSLMKIPQQKVHLNIVKAALGSISNIDIDLALSTNALILVFNAHIPNSIFNLIKQNNLDVKKFLIIYDLLNYVNQIMLDLVDPEYEKIFIGSAIVQTVFYINKGSVAGCFVNQGKLKKMSYIYIYNKNKLVYEGQLVSLKRLKDNVDEVFAETECGIMCNYNKWEEEDRIEAYDLVLKEKTL